MKKIWILLIFIFFFSALNCRADEVLTEDKIIEEYSQDESINSNLNSLYTYIDNMKTDIELINDLNPVEYIKSYIKNGEGNISFSLICIIVTPPRINSLFSTKRCTSYPIPILIVSYLTFFSCYVKIYKRPPKLPSEVCSSGKGIRTPDTTGMNRVL